jgi:hypothetical protein
VELYLHSPVRLHGVVLSLKKARIAQWCSAGPRLEDRGSDFDSRRRLGIFLFTTASRPVLGPTQPSIQRVTGALSLGVKRWGHETDHSPLSCAEVKNASSYTSTPQYAFMALCSVKSTETTVPFILVVSFRYCNLVNKMDHIYSVCSQSLHESYEIKALCVWNGLGSGSPTMSSETTPWISTKLAFEAYNKICQEKLTSVLYNFYFTLTSYITLSQVSVTTQRKEFIKLYTYLKKIYNFHLQLVSI